MISDLLKFKSYLDPWQLFKHLYLIPFNGFLLKQNFDWTIFHNHDEIELILISKIFGINKAKKSEIYSKEN